MDYKDISLSSLMSEDEFRAFEDIFKEVKDDYQDILGIVATGSLFQCRDYFKFDNLSYKVKNNYFSIDAVKSRNLGFSKTSDIDIWVTLKDKNMPENILEELNQKAIELINAYSDMDLELWAKSCKDTFGEYVKNEKYYSEDWVSKNNGQYWESRRFQNDVIDLMTQNMGDFCSRFSYFFDKSLSTFLEIRAFPESLLHVKMASVNTTAFDRVPLPIYLKSWLTDHNTRVLYAHDDANIFPFKSDGIILGDEIGKHFGLDKLTDEELYLRKF